MRNPVHRATLFMCYELTWLHRPLIQHILYGDRHNYLLLMTFASSSTFRLTCITRSRPFTGVPDRLKKHSFNIYSTFIQHSFNIHSTFIQHSFNIHSTFIQHSFNIHSTFKPFSLSSNWIIGKDIPGHPHIFPGSHWNYHSCTVVQQL